MSDFSVGFDAMGLTDNSNPIGLMPFLNPGFGIIGKRKKRHSGKTTDPDLKPHKIAGGERYNFINEKTKKEKLDNENCYYCEFSP